MRAFNVLLENDKSEATRISLNFFGDQCAGGNSFYYRISHNIIRPVPLYGVRSYSCENKKINYNNIKQ